jgi:hypothetical protein
LVGRSRSDLRLGERHLRIIVNYYVDSSKLKGFVGGTIGNGFIGYEWEP